MLGTNAKKRERDILQFLYLNRPVDFSSTHIREHTDTPIGVAEALTDLIDYGFAECKNFDEIKIIDQMLKHVQGKTHEIYMPKYQITPEGIKYIEITEFNSHKDKSTKTKETQ